MLPGRARLLMFLKNLFLVICGLSAGGMVAAGTFAFIVMIGIFTRLAERTRTAKYISVYENMIVAGGSIGNIIYIYQISLPFGYTGIIVYGLFSGVFVGCLAMALAEVLKVFPILINRVGLVKGLPYIVTAIAAGKLAGSLLGFTFGGC